MKVGFIFLGCPKNTVNGEQMVYLVKQAGHEIVTAPEQADAVIINTCAFIESAIQEAINNILEVAQWKAEGKIKYIVVTGCLAQRFKDEILQDLPEVDALLGISSYGQICEVLENLNDESPVLAFRDKNGPVEEIDRVVSTGKNYAYLRIAEGCNNCCTFCIIPKIRGRYRSRSMDAIVKEAESLVAQGYTELILIAQDVTRYGEDLYGQRALPTLLRRLCAIEGLGWLRLHYLYPEAFSDELIDLIASEPKIVKYMDIPLQHINDNILKAMNRHGTGEDIRNLITKLRERIPGVVLRTSLIAGLPGEGEEEFEELCDFLRQAKIERAGVFPYSPEDGTAAALMPRVDKEVAEHRAELIQEIQAQIMEEYSNNQIGETIDVLFEDIDPVSGFGIGRSQADSPDIDWQVFFDDWAGYHPGQIIPVFIKDTDDGDLIGSAVQES